MPHEDRSGGTPRGESSTMRQPAARVGEAVRDGGTRNLITAHAVIRWLERAEGVDLRPIRRAARREGCAPGDDGALVRFIETATDIDLAPARRALGSAEVRLAIRIKATAIRVGPVVAVLKAGAVVTVKWPTRNRPYGRGHSLPRRAPSRRDRRYLADAAE